MFSPDLLQAGVRVAGPAFTVRFERNIHQKQKPKLAEHWVDSTPADSILFLSAPADSPSAVYGDLMSRRAKYLGARATFVDGNFRDIDTQRELRWPVFAKNVSVPADAEVTYAAAMNVPVRLQSTTQEVWVNPGDILVGDCNGVVCIPQELTEKVSGVLADLKKIDDDTAAAIEDGMSVTEAFAKFRSH
ncbi:unnamed protein product [Jaminaea pallidilutea]